MKPNKSTFLNPKVTLVLQNKKKLRQKSWREIYNIN